MVLNYFDLRYEGQSEKEKRTCAVRLQMIQSILAIFFSELETTIGNYPAIYAKGKRHTIIHTVTYSEMGHVFG